MHVYKNLYCDEETKRSKKKIIRKIKYHAGLSPSLHVIAMSDGNDYFDIIPGYCLKQKQYPLDNLHIVGLAGDYNSAMDMIPCMLADFEKKYGSLYFKEAFLYEKEMNFTGYNRK